MIDPQNAIVYRHILQKAQQLGDRRLELMVRHKLQPPRPCKERIYSTPTGCVIIDFPVRERETTFAPPKPRRMWLTITGCLFVYPGSVLALLMLSAFLT